MDADVIILRRSIDKDNKVTGIGVYADKIKSLLDDNNLVSDEIFFKLTSDEGHLKCVTHGLILPTYHLNKVKGKMYHATDEFCCLAYPFFKGKKITTFHHVFKETEREGKSPMLYAFWKMAAKYALKYSDAMIAVSQQTKDELVEILGADPDKIHVLNHSSNKVFKDLKRPRKKLIGFVGTLIERKNVEVGIRAFKLFSEMPDMEEYNMVICGDGPLKKDLINLVEVLDISDKITFVSNITQNELMNLYNDMAVFVNPSLHEGLGLTAMEAKTCGVPVVYFKDAEIPSEIAEYYVPSDDIEDFANNMYRLVTDKKFRDFFVNKPIPGLSDEEYSRELFKIYSEVIGEKFP